jgi:hypothetical protein
MITVEIAVTVAASVAHLAAIAATLNIVAGGLAIVVTALRLGELLRAKRRGPRKPCGVPRRAWSTARRTNGGDTASVVRGDGRDGMRDTATSSVLVVIADPELRQLVGWLVGELDLAYVPVATWRAGVAPLTPRPSLLLCDIDDLHESPMAFAALAAHGWDVPVPLIILSRRPDVEAIAGAFGAVEGLRKPINTGRLMSTVSRYVATASPFDGA